MLNTSDVSPFAPIAAALDLSPANLLGESLARTWTNHSARGQDRLFDHHGDEAMLLGSRLAERALSGDLVSDWQQWWVDAAQRQVLFLDTLRERGNDYLQHEADGAPPVLIYDHELVIDGADLPRPCNYILLKILPPEGQSIDDSLRPFIIIDPRAGHGAGIGGFKPDSQVGVALAKRQPVYFVAFRPVPEPGQTIAHIVDAEAAFVKKVSALHPESPKPIVIGNCQGGWAAAILAATHSELTGPIVLSGAPMSYWSGTVGQDPMRYSGGLAGGALPALVMSDLSGGLFDGAHLVQNFEDLSPGNTKFRKYYDLYAKGDTARERFLEFERWWGGVHLMTDAEMRWIVENLFVGNRLVNGTAELEPGRPINLKSIKAPMIVFASRGDTITPPPQALNWIADTYSSESEIEVRGQRIVYTVHDEVGHLGIFVSSKVATREHTQIASILETIEALPPGLYELLIEDVVGEGDAKEFRVSFARRTLQDIASYDDWRGDERAFAAVARASESLVEWYEGSMQPMVKASVPQGFGEAMRAAHPIRWSRSAFSDMNPWMHWLPAATEQVRSEREPAALDNPFLMAERWWADATESAMERRRAWQELGIELAFFSLWANPLAVLYGKPRDPQPATMPEESLAHAPEVTSALAHIESGGYGEAVIRMLVLAAATRESGVRRSRLERSFSVLTTRQPFASMDTEARARLVHEQSLIARFAPERALETLPGLLTRKSDRTRALKTVAMVIGKDDVDEATQTFLDELDELLVD
jgi:pimeloyl-ACP methyl ester carboxylesterase